ncbi:hypothetical protein FIBSPDRAFT_869816 [Athelia psychrophila]|uniref:Uncharacterized protein n=1 Tax=Athelia psychrophila TaxID=1759441 RepID=A0A166BNT6_9AGAM|nr:hypothetical protein FIBSPDRAFT_869816 [Fibularhizoctonia sp. CBS 109695]
MSKPSTSFNSYCTKNSYLSPDKVCLGEGPAAESKVYSLDASLAIPCPRRCNASGHWNSLAKAQYSWPSSRSSCLFATRLGCHVWIDR